MKGKKWTACLAAVLLVAMSLLLGGCSGKELSALKAVPAVKKAVDKAQEPEDPADFAWNKNDLDPFQNGNVELAKKALKKTPDLITGGENANPAAIIQTPWNYYGKLLRFHGMVGFSQKFPPNSEEAKTLGSATEGLTDVSIVTDDETIVEFWIPNTKMTINEGDQVLFGGYVVGRMEVPNRYGGTFTHLIVVGGL